MNDEAIFLCLQLRIDITFAFHLSGITISYRSGSRYNPDEEAYEKIQDHSTSDSKVSKDSIKREKGRDGNKSSTPKKGKQTKENINPENKRLLGEKEKNSPLDVEQVMIHSETKSPSKSQLKIVSETGGLRDSPTLRENKNINIDVDDYVDTGAIPKQSVDK